MWNKIRYYALKGKNVIHFLLVGHRVFSIFYSPTPMSETKGGVWLVAPIQSQLQQQQQQQQVNNTLE